MEKSKDIALNRRSRNSGLIAGGFYGAIAAIIGAPALVVGTWLYLLPAYAYRVTVIGAELAPIEIKRAELGGWPLSPALRSPGAIEFHIERSRHAEMDLTLEIRRPGDGGELTTRIPIRARETRLTRPSTHICDLAVFVSANATHATPCMSGPDDF